jgi:hypothetical protein
LQVAVAVELEWVVAVVLEVIKPLLDLPCQLQHIP